VEAVFQQVHPLLPPAELDCQVQVPATLTVPLAEQLPFA
jgi:hypothetical protein